LAEMVANPPAIGAVRERFPELSVVPVNGRSVSISTQCGIVSGAAWRTAETDLPEEVSEPKMSVIGFVGKTNGPETGGAGILTSNCQFPVTFVGAGAGVGAGTELVLQARRDTKGIKINALRSVIWRRPMGGW
jgi:hypothetical protein